MVIQRNQSVYLLIAVIIMVVFAFVPALTFELAERRFSMALLKPAELGTCTLTRC